MEEIRSGVAILTGSVPNTNNNLFKHGKYWSGHIPITENTSFVILDPIKVHFSQGGGRSPHRSLKGRPISKYGQKAGKVIL